MEIQQIFVDTQQIEINAKNRHAHTRKLYTCMVQCKNQLYTVYVLYISYFLFASLNVDAHYMCWVQMIVFSVEMV